jgi:hypothetical protein
MGKMPMPLKIADSMSSDPVELQYAQPLPWHRRPRARKMIYLSAAILVALSAFIWGPEIWRRCEAVYWEKQCMAYTAPPDQVVYSDVPETVAALQAQPGYAAKGGAVSYTPVELQKVLSRIVPTVFIHERKTKNGDRFLVEIVVLTSTQDAGNGSTVLVLDGWAFPPKSLITRPRPSISGDGEAMFVPMRAMTVFAGQPDSEDASHFTIRVKAGAEDKIVDGWLKEDGRVVLQERLKPATVPLR